MTNVIIILCVLCAFLWLLLIFEQHRRKDAEEAAQVVENTLKDTFERHHKDLLMLSKQMSNDTSYSWYLRNLLNNHAIEHWKYEEFDAEEWRKSWHGERT